MKVVELFIIVLILCFGAAGWWYVASHVSELRDLDLAEVARMTQEVFQGLLKEAEKLLPVAKS